MTDERGVHPVCRNASNPYHESYQQIFGENLLMVLKLCIKKKKKKTNKQNENTRKLCVTLIFGSPNLTILKKKSKNTIKYHNIFSIPSFLGSE